MEHSIGKRTQTRMVKRKKTKKTKGLAWINIGYIVVFALIIFTMGRFI